MLIMLTNFEFYNSKHPSIRFTCEIENNSRLHVLYLFVSQKNRINFRPLYITRTYSPD